MTSAPRQRRANPPRPTRPVAPLPASRRTLTWLVLGSTLAIVVIWVAVVGMNLGRSAQGEDSLFTRIKEEVLGVFQKDDSSETNTSLTNEQIDDLERRVFPNVNVTDSGTFRIP